MQHVKAILETWNAFMPQCLVIMLDDAHDQVSNYFLTSGMLQSSPLKEISSRDYRVPKPMGRVMEKEMCQAH